MARLWMTGFECNSIDAGSAGDEWDVANVGTPTIDSTVKRSGSYSLKIDGEGNRIRHRFIKTGTGNAYYLRFYFYISTLPSSELNIAGFINSADSGINILCSTSGVLRLLEDGGSQVGSSSSALSTGEWYRVELKTQSASTRYELKIDGVSIASGDGTVGYSNIRDVYFGDAGSGGATGVFYFDDVALNDSSGSYQTSYPGSGQIVYSRPNADGDNHQWTKSDGNTAGDTNNYQEVDEVNPDNATTFLKYDNDDTAVIDDYNCQSSSDIGLSGTVTLVAVRTKIRTNSANGDIDWVTPRIKASASGTVSEGTKAWTASANVWRTFNLDNTATGDTEYGQEHLVSYKKPGTSDDWTTTDVDSMQIGIKNGASSGTFRDVTAVYAMIEYVAPINYTKTLSDSVALAEGIKKSPGKPVSDSMSISETSSVIRGLFKTLEDSMSMAELFAGDGLEMSRSIDAPSDIVIADSLVKSPVKVLTDTLAVLDVISKTIGLPQSDSVSISESSVVGFSSIKTIEDTIALAEALVQAIGVNKSDSVALADVLIDSVGKTLTETILLTDSISNTMGKSLTESFSILESLATLLQKGIILTDSVTLDESIVRVFGKTLTELISITDSIAKTVGIPFSDTISLVESVSNAVGKPFSESIGIVESAVIAFGKRPSDSVSVLEDVVIQKTIGKFITDNLDLAEVIQKTTGKPLSDSFTIAEAVIMTPGLIRRETIALGDVLSDKTVVKNLTETIDITESLVKTSGLSFSDSLSLLDAISKTTGKPLSDSVSIADEFAKILVFGILPSDSVSISDTVMNKSVGKIIFELVSLTDAFALLSGKSFSESIAITESVIKTPGVVLSESITIVEALVKLYGRNIAESFSVTDAIAKTSGITFSESFALLDVISKTTGKPFSESITIAESLVNAVGLIRSESITITESESKINGKNLAEAFSLADSISKTTGKPLSDSIVVLDSILKTPGVVVSDSIGITESFIKTFGKGLSDMLEVGDGTGLKFNGSSSIVDIGSPALLASLSGSFTFECRVKLNRLTAARFFGAKRTNTANGFSPGHQSAGKLLFTTFGVKDYITTGVYLTTGQEYHVCYVLNSDYSVDFYVDGVYKETVTHTAGMNPNTDDGWLIGATTVTSSSTLSGPLNGVMYEMRIYDRVLSSTEIAQHANREFQNESDLITLYKFNEGGGSDVYDSSGNGYHGTMTNGTWITEGLALTVGKSLSDSIAVVDSVSKLTGLPFAEIISITESVVKVTGKNITESLSIVDVLVKTYGMTKTELVDINDSLVKVIGMTLTDLMSFTDAQGFLKTIHLDEVLAITDSISKYVQIIKSESVSVIDFELRTVGKIISDNIDIAESLVKLSGIGVSDSIIITDVLTRAVGKSVSDLLDLSDSVQKTFGQSLSDIISVADSISTEAGISLSDSIALADVLTGKGVGKNITETLVILDSVTTKGVTKSILDSLSISDEKVLTSGKILSETIAIAETLALLRKLEFGESLSIVESLAKVIGKPITETVSILDSVVVSTGLFKSFSEAVSVLDGISKTPGKPITDTMTIAEVLGIGQTKILSDIITVADTIVRTFVDNYDRLYVVKEDIFSKKSKLYQPFTSGLVIYFRSDENVGSQLKDISSNKFIANLSGSPSWAVGKYGYAIDYDGTNDYALVNDNDSLDGFSELTVALWAYLDEIPSGGGNPYQTLLTRYSWWGPYSIILETSGKIKFSASLEYGKTTRLDSITTFTSGSWYHLAMTSVRDGYLKVYVNGVLDNSVAQVYSIGRVSNKMTIGGQDEGTSHRFNGKLDEILIYNRELSASEVLVLYQNIPQKVLEKFKGPRKKVMYQNRALHSRKNF